jgi:amino acid adenylation domain-containing protein
MSDRLQHLLERTAQRASARVALIDAVGGTLSYGELDARSNVIADLLLASGVRPGDRVGLFAPKSIPLVVALFGILKARAAYVPVDPAAPVARAGYIVNDCAVRAVIGDAALLAKLRDAPESGLPGVLETGVLPGGLALLTANAPPGEPPAATDLAYILYTSGSTGKPKGVMHRHSSALAFVDWCSDVLAPTADDRFSSHAPFHFDLSILDLYVPLKHGASLVLIDEQNGKHPTGLAELIETSGITIWYSTPSILRLLLEFGRLDERDHSRLRIVCFAGEVFPIRNFEALAAAWPRPRLLNLYGPTETNVCTWYEARPADRVGRATPLPIGTVCAGDRGRVVDGEGQPVARGAEGELLVSGGTVMAGYWNLPERNAAAFAIDADGTRWYRTGDIVTEDAQGCYTFLGRRDRMVKRRSYRVELGEIEAALYRHAAVREAAVIATPDPDNGVLITAFLACQQDERLSVIELKRHSSETLPLYMVPDRFRLLPALPKTSTDKIDYQRLKEL